MKSKVIIYFILLLVAVSAVACRSQYPAAPYHYWHGSGGGPRRHYGAPRHFTTFNMFRSNNRRGHKVNYYKGRYRQ